VEEWEDVYEEDEEDEGATLAMEESWAVLVGVFYKFALVKDECTQYLLETHGMKKFMDVYLGKTSPDIENRIKNGEWR